MPEIDLEPKDYRRKRTILYKVSHASKRDLLIATLLGIWVVAALALKLLPPFSDQPPIFFMAVGLAPGALWLLWIAFTD